MDNYLNYFGNDLGANYSAQMTSFRLWAPSAERVELCIYENGDGDCRISSELMRADVNGTWVLNVYGDLHGTYYTYLVTCNGRTRESQDPYAKAVGVNGVRSMVVDLNRTNPQGFLSDKHVIVDHPTDAIVYEISVSDQTIDQSSGIKNAGKYLGLTEKNTKNAAGYATGIDYIKELGVTHVQIMPAYDFGSIDESHPEVEQYNWGYDPINYNVPEGYYSTDPFHGEVRIKEFKQMVQAFHKEGIGVIMDVVFNHTYDIENNCFQKCVPDYYYRKDEHGFSNASACGNEVASEKPMVRKFIVDSVCYWAKEYHIDGFRFDLMGILDLETMKEIRRALDKICPGIIIYGEGWVGGDSPIPEELRAMKRHVHKIGGVGAFSDDIRDNTRGSVFYDKDTGFASGKQGLENAVKYSVVGACEHPMVDYKSYTYSEGAWANAPTEIVNYVSCHDNMTLWDKLYVSCADADEDTRLAMNRLCAAMVLTAQGIPFFLSGEEIARSKPIMGSNNRSENSFNLPVYTNKIRYENRTKYAELFEYYKGLIGLRKKYQAFRLSTANDIRQSICFNDDYQQPNVVTYTICKDEHEIVVVYNANPYEVEISLPKDCEYGIYAKGRVAGTKKLETAKNKIVVEPISCLIAIKDK